MPICIVASWEAIEKRVGEYMAAFLLMETLMIGVFAAQDLFLFYIFFEAGLIPMYLIIGIWGGADRIYASYKFFLYTLLGSVLMLIAMLWMVQEAGTTDIPTLMANDFPVAGADLAVARLLRQLRGQDADVAGPYLAARRARPGADRGLGDPGGRAAEDGRLRLHPLLAADVPRGRRQLIWLVFGLSMVAVVYTSLVALVQHDMKKLIAYSSVAHMAIVTVGLFAFNLQGLEGAMMVMLSHGLVSGALFLCVGVIYDRLHTREIDRYGGLSINMPKYALFFMLFTMASVGLPGTSGFVGEFLSLAGIYQVSSWVTLALHHRHHPRRGLHALSLPPRRLRRAEERRCRAMPDLSRREMAMLAPIAAAVLWMGVYPESFLAPMRDDIAALDARVARAARGDAQLTIGKHADACRACGGAPMNASLLLSLPELVLSARRARAAAGRRLGRPGLDQAGILASVAVLVGAGIALMRPASSGGEAFGGQYRADAFAAFAKLLIYIAAAAALVVAPRFFEPARATMRAEYPVLILLAALGMGMMVSAGDLMTLYIGLELQTSPPTCWRASCAATRVRPRRGSSISCSARSPAASCCSA